MVNRHYRTPGAWGQPGSSGPRAPVGKLGPPRKPREPEDLMPHRPDFVAESANDSFEHQPTDCEGSALTTELTARNRSYFSPDFDTCQKGGACFVLPAGHDEIMTLLSGYILCARSEGRSPSTIDIAARSVRFFEDFL
jgi:hypothetical protein